MEPAWTLVQAGGSSNGFRPRIEWVDLFNLGATPFVLDDATENREWGSFIGGLKSAVHSLNGMLA